MDWAKVIARILGELVRHGLTAVGALMVSGGLLTQVEEAKVIGALMVLVSVASAAILRVRQHAADNSADKLNQEELEHIKDRRHHAQRIGKKPNAHD